MRSNLGSCFRMLSAALCLLAASCGGGSGGSTSKEIPSAETLGAVRAQESVGVSETREARGDQADPLARFEPRAVARLTDTARFLAGMPAAEGGPLAALREGGAWSAHARFLDAGWKQLEEEALSGIRRWSATELGDMDPTTVFYPFSGPDFLFAYAFFPKGKDYLLVGLEPVGDVPALEALSQDEAGAKLKWVRQSIGGILQYSFFRTNDMKVDMAEEGVLPILLVFLARSGNRVLDVAYVGLDGEPLAKDPAEKDQATARAENPRAVRIAFLPEGQDSVRTLYYFSVDLSDYSLQGKGEFTRFIKSFPRPATYLKAASYLMYRDKYTRTRSLILSRSACLLQDDSGIPFEAFDGRRWDFKLYGAYSKPINLFEERYQPDLQAAYVARREGLPLAFGVGYKHRTGESNLMLAVAREWPAPQAPACPGAGDLLSKGLFEEAAGAFRASLEGRREVFGIRVEVACQPSSIAEDVQRAGGDPRFLILPASVEDRSCYHALWGLYPSKVDAVAALDELPERMARGVAPQVVRLDGGRPRG